MNFISKARRAKGLTMKEMSKEMNMSIGGYSKLEYGINKLTLARFIQACNTLNLDVTTVIKEVQEDE